MMTGLTQSTTFKVLGIGLLALLMLIPLAQVQGLIGERTALREQAVATIAQRWGGQQQLGGPVLAIPKRTRAPTNTGWIMRESIEILLPDQLDIRGTLAPEMRQYGMYAQNLSAAAFGVALYQPAGVYQRNERAGKYGVLFIALTFVAFFLFEVLKKLRVHPVQYLLVGLALTTFYVVLLALSEQIGFGFAYLIAAVAVVAIVAGYAGAVLRARRAGLILGAALALVYALLYGLIVSEQYSLLMGALALLAVVAALMYLTRKVDWYTGVAALAPAAR